MYSREYGDRTLHFEASGGLINSSLVMQDKETDSYWSIMEGRSIEGEFKGTGLVELPGNEKALWKDWARKHPETLVLSIGGKEDAPSNPYKRYATSDEGFRGATATDKRLETKQAVFAFRFKGQAFAAPFDALEGGKVIHIEEVSVFLFRPKRSNVFQSTVAYRADVDTFKQVDGKWIHTGSGATFNENLLTFDDTPGRVVRLAGFDTFWYTWSPFRTDTVIIR